MRRPFMPPCRMLRAMSVLLAALLSPAIANSDPMPGMALQHHAMLLSASVVRGSAFYLAETLVATNAHVVAGLAPGATVTLHKGSAPEAAVTAQLIAVSSHADIAFLRAPAGFLLPPRATTTPPMAGSMLRAAGLRGGIDGIEPVEVTGSATGRAVTIAAFGSGITVHMDGAGPGFSGGPAIGADGSLVGMVAAIRHGGSMHPAGSAFAPLRHSATGPKEVFVLDATLLQTEARRLLGPAWNRP